MHFSVNFNPFIQNYFSQLLPPHFDEILKMEEEAPFLKIKERYFNFLEFLKTCSWNDQVRNLSFFEEHFKYELEGEGPCTHFTSLPIVLQNLMWFIYCYKGLKTFSPHEWEQLTSSIAYFPFTSDRKEDYPKGVEYLKLVHLLVENDFAVTKPWEQYDKKGLPIPLAIRSSIDKLMVCGFPKEKFLDAFLYLHACIKCFFSEQEIREAVHEGLFHEELLKILDNPQFHEIVKYTALFIPSLSSVDQVRTIISELSQITYLDLYCKPLLAYAREKKQFIPWGAVITSCSKIEPVNFDSFFKKYITLDCSIGVAFAVPINKGDNFYRKINYLYKRLNSRSIVHDKIDFDQLRKYRTRRQFTIKDLPKNANAFQRLKKIYESLRGREENLFITYLNGCFHNLFYEFETCKYLMDWFSLCGTPDQKIECTAYYFHVCIKAILEAPALTNDASKLSTQDEMLLGFLYLLFDVNESRQRDGITQFYYHLPLRYRIKSEDKTDFVFQIFQKVYELVLDEYTRKIYGKECRFSSIKLLIKDYAFEKIGLLHTLEALDHKDHEDHKIKKLAKNFYKTIDVSQLIASTEKHLEELIQDLNLKHFHSLSSITANDLLSQSGFLKQGS